MSTLYNTVYSLWQETDRRSQDRNRQSRKLCGRISLPRPIIPDDLAFWNSVSLSLSLSLLYSTYFFFLFLQIYIIYIYIYIVLDIVWSKVYIRQCMIPLVIFLISYFCSVVSIIRHIRFVVWQFVHRTPRYDLFSSVALFRISYLFPPHRSPLCMQYIIWYRVLFFFEIFVWINHVPHVME